MQRTLIVTFYAYKGGTGRTLALSNVARFLADERGYRVGLVDLDIDSPGLVHEALCADLDSESSSRDDLLRQIDGKDGFLQLFIESAQNRNVPDVDRFVCALPSERGGNLLLMPTARGSIYDKSLYAEFVSTFADAVAEAGATEASNITYSILVEFANRYQLDFLFLDGRTGTGQFFPVYVYSIPHLLVLFTGLNDQNVIGSLSVLDARSEGKSPGVPVFLVASPVPTVGPGQFEQRLAFITSEIAKRRNARDPGDGYIYDLPQGVDHVLYYSDAATFGEVYFPRAYPHALLTQAYRKLASSIEQQVLVEPTTSLSPTTLDNYSSNLVQAKVPSRSIRIAMEDVHVDLLEDMLAKDPLHGLDVITEPWSAEDEDSPWERLFNLDPKDAKYDDDFDKLVTDLPDIFVVPQVYLEEFSKVLLRKANRNDKEQPILYSQGELRASTREALHFLDYRHLDTYYPNWRRWCSVGQRIMALPFSVNAMLLCANESKLGPICDDYWALRQQHPRHQNNSPSFFLPSNWPALIELLQSPSAGNRADGDCVFRIVGTGRGFYYEWLNMVASLGGFDLVHSEGRILQDIAISRPETIEATKLFVQLATLCGKECQAENMTAQIKDFAEQKLAMYVGWTDSFRFTWKGDKFVGASTVPIDDKDQTKPATPLPFKLRLGRCPRDMRHGRTSLVDGWVMTFPRKESDGTLNDRLRFAHWFLDHERQRKALQRGFPSPSAWAISQELDALAAERIADAGRESMRSARSSGVTSSVEDSYEPFLHTMRAAVDHGQWVASLRKAIFERIKDTVLGLVRQGEQIDVEAAMKQLDKDVRKELGPVV